MISIIILNYNTFNLTCQCISSVYDQTKGVEFEIVLVDNASTECNPDKFLEQFPLVKKKYVDEIIVNFGNKGTCNFVKDELFLMEKYYLYTKYSFFNRFHYGYICLKHYLKNRKIILAFKTLLLFPKFIAMCFIKISK